MYIVKYDYHHDDGCVEYGLEEEFEEYEAARDYYQGCKDDEWCEHIELIYPEEE